MECAGRLVLGVCYVAEGVTGYQPGMCGAVRAAAQNTQLTGRGQVTVHDLC